MAFVVFLTGAAGNIDRMIFENAATNVFGPLVSLALLLPGLAVAVRRLHDLDLDRTGQCMLIAFTGVGIIPLLIWDCMKGTDGPNRFGPNPLAHT